MMNNLVISTVLIAFDLLTEQVINVRMVSIRIFNRFPNNNISSHLLQVIISIVINYIYNFTRIITQH